jgi:putative DNA primase/helicase
MIGDHLAPFCTGNFPSAAEYVEAGISVIPVELNGSKSPFSSRLPTVAKALKDAAIPDEEKAELANRKPWMRTWIPYQYRLPTENELFQFFRRPAGIGIVCGIASGGLEVLDFDSDADRYFYAWRERLSDSIVGRLCVIETGGGGYHCLYRCETISENIKLAMTIDKKTTFIETRGHGGYIVGVGSPSSVHKSGHPYIQTFGELLPAVPTFTPEQRKEMFVAAAAFDQRTDVLQEYARRRARELRPPSDHQIDTSTPWGDFDVRGSWDEILQPAGWYSTDGVLWTRAGKTGGTSAKVVRAQNGCELLTVYSSNAGPLAPKVGSYKSWGKTDAFVELYYPGNRSAACKELRTRGYGK